MKLWFRNHHYQTTIFSSLSSRWSKYFGSYKVPVNTFVMHMSDCCDYWLPINDKKAQDALMMDDDFKVFGRNDE